MEKEKISLTKAGREQLQLELNHLVNFERKHVIEELQDARAQGDLSENADYDSARKKQAEVEGRIKEIEYILQNCVIVDEKSTGAKNVVKLGSLVTIKDESDGTVETYSIVGSIEADPFEGKISNESPLANAILGKKVGDKVTIKVDSPYDVEIVKIVNN